MGVAELQLWEELREQWLRSLMVVAILLLNVLDVVTTQHMLARGGTELNPLSARLIEVGMLPVTKVSVAGFIAVAAVAATSRKRVSTLLMLVAGFYLAVVTGNSLQLLLAS